jgi:hypothetical protein
MAMTLHFFSAASRAVGLLDRAGRASVQQTLISPKASRSLPPGRWSLLAGLAHGLVCQTMLCSSLRSSSLAFSLLVSDWFESGSSLGKLSSSSCHTQLL